MAITAAQVKELREMTGAGMMDCKKALTATEGDMDKAVEFLREKGLAAATKKAGRIAAEGVVKTLLSDDHNAVVVEVNSETDFVAKNEKFQNYVAEVAAQALTTSAADIEAFLAEPWAADTSKTVNEALAGQIAIIGENMNIRRFQQVKEDAGFTRNELSEYLESKRIQTRNLFAGNLLKHPAFDEMRKEGTGYRVIGDLKGTDFVMTNTFWIGVYPGMSPEMLEFMISTIKEFVASKQ